MSAAEFWETRLHDFFIKLDYYYRKQQADRIERANLVRMQTVALINIQLSKKDRIRDPKLFWRFPWEGEDVAESTAREDGGENTEYLQTLIKAL